jgi:hypothetical protein
MTTLEQVMENLRKLVGKEYEEQELAEEIICGFEDFETDSSSNGEVIIGEDGQVWQCYVNSKDATVISVQVEKLYNNNGFLIGYKVTDVWA